MSVLIDLANPDQEDIIDSSFTEATAPRGRICVDLLAPPSVLAAEGSAASVCRPVSYFLGPPKPSKPPPDPLQATLRLANSSFSSFF